MDKIPVQSKRKKTVGVVGFGKRGILQASLVNMNPDAEWKAACDTDPEWLDFVKCFYPNIQFFSNLDEMMDAAGLDSIFICTPDHTHLSLVEKLAAREVNIFVEPPLAETFSSSLEMMRLISGRNNVFSLGYVFPFKRLFLKARELLNEGAVEGIRRYRASWCCSLNIRSTDSGRIFIDQMSSFFHLLRWLFGPVESLYARGPRTLSELNTGISLVVDHSSGLLGLLELSWNRPGYPLPAVNISAEGTGGTLDITEDHLKLYLYRKKDKMDKGWTTIDVSDLPAAPGFFLCEEGLSEGNSSFLECCDRQTGPQIGWEDGLEVMRMIEAVRLSIGEQRVIVLNEVQ